MQSENDAVAARDAPYSAWEFVHCGVCYLPFINPRNPDAPPVIPFWLTECAHVVCNKHLNADRTCRQCSDGKPIELMPLQLDLPEPMSKWFQPLPDAILDLVGASKFQHDTMANLIRFYKNKCVGQKELIERLRREVDTLKAEANQMRQPSEFMRSFQEDTIYEPINENGKRRRIEAGRQGSLAFEHESRQKHNSSSLDARLGSSRLTLRPGSSHMEQQQRRSYLANTSADQPTLRQGTHSSPISLKEFAYQPTSQEDGRGGTARGSISSFNAGTSTSPSTYRPVAAPINFSAGTSQSRAASSSTNEAQIERFKPPFLNGRDNYHNQPSATRQRFNPAPVLNVTPKEHSNRGSGRIEGASSLNYPKALSSVSVQGSRPFVPQTPNRQSLNQVSMLGRQHQQRPQSQLQMPPPPLPNSSRFR